MSTSTDVAHAGHRGDRGGARSRTLEGRSVGVILGCELPQTVAPEQAMVQVSDRFENRARIPRDGIARVFIDTRDATGDLV